MTLARKTPALLLVVLLVAAALPRVAAAQDSSLQSDNRAETALRVTDPPRVLLLDDASTGGRISPLAAALAPYAMSGRSPAQSADPVALTLAPLSSPPPRPLGEFDALVVSGAGALDEERALQIERYVARGGLALLVPAAADSPAAWNQRLHRDGLGLLPWRVDWGPADRVRGASALPPLGMAPAAAAALANARTWRWFELSTDSRTSPLMRLSLPPVEADANVLPAEPLLVEASVGRGRLMVLATSLDGAWNDFPDSPVFVELCQSIVRRLLTPDAMTIVRAGEPLAAWFDRPIDPRSVQVFAPGGGLLSPSEVRFESRGGRWVVRTSEPTRPGRYRLRLSFADEPSVQPRVAQEVWVAAASQSDSDLRPLSAEELSDLARLWGLARIDPARHALGEVVGRARGGRELWLPLLLASLIIGVGEAWLAGRWTATTGPRRREP